MSAGVSVTDPERTQIPSDAERRPGIHSDSTCSPPSSWLRR